jgi:hypothetical protein
MANRAGTFHAQQQLQLQALVAELPLMGCVQETLAYDTPGSPRQHLSPLVHKTGLISAAPPLRGSQRVGGEGPEAGQHVTATYRSK